MPASDCPIHGTAANYRCPVCGADAIYMAGMDEWLLPCHQNESAVADA